MIQDQIRPYFRVGYRNLSHRGQKKYSSLKSWSWHYKVCYKIYITANIDEGFRFHL